MQGRRDLTVFDCRKRPGLVTYSKISFPNRGVMKAPSKNRRYLYVESSRKAVTECPTSVLGNLHYRLGSWRVTARPKSKPDLRNLLGERLVNSCTSNKPRTERLAWKHKHTGTETRDSTLSFRVTSRTLSSLVGSNLTPDSSCSHALFRESHGYIVSPLLRQHLIA